MNALAPIDIDRLAKVCGLFSSVHDGERASAAAFADKIVRGAGLTWPDILGRPPELTAGGYSETSRRREGHLSPGEILARHGDRITAWERTFLASIIRRPPPWSPRQMEVLREIRERVGGAAR